MALFLSLAYLALSLDATGLLRCLALWVAHKGGASGARLHAYLYLFFLACAAVVGNDPVVLSGTTFLAYLTRMAGIVPPTAWIFAQFTAANIASAVLISSNPTNLVLAGAFSLSFVTYTSAVALPALAAALLAYPFQRWVLFRAPGLIPRALELPADEVGSPSAALVDRPGAVLGSAVLLATLGVLVGTSTLGVPVWQVTVPPAVAMALRDAGRDWVRFRRARRAAAKAQPLPAGDLGDTVAEPWTVSSLLDGAARVFPTVHGIAQKLPLPLVPFALLMFVLVQGLASQGWVGVFAGWWGTWVARTGVVGAGAGMALGAGLLCNVCGTNIGTTILLARMLQEWEAAGGGDPRERYAGVYGLAVGSNLGAFTLTFSASLAGLLWRDMLRQKGIVVRQAEFAALNAGTFLVATAAASAVVIGQALRQ
ncbi:hypothetical protein BC834DRAFT_940015 [Gloeopeniophorella convolvens]|nr:hypothetical protein BC834DRAFT_940015 [Gloeopeniophorella convolvens]